jgi:hypothetical protein
MDQRTPQGSSRIRDAGIGVSRAGLVCVGLCVGVAALTAAGLFLVLAPPSYRAEAHVEIGARASGLLGIRARVLSHEGDPSESVSTKGQAQLVASRDLARRAIEDLDMDTRPEFDVYGAAPSPASRLLVLLGLKRDPSRLSRADRILQAYEDRLSVSAEPRSRIIKIMFESEDRDLAARAANRIADLYLEMRAETMKPMLGTSEARIVSRAVSRTRPVPLQAALGLGLGLTATFAAAVGSVFASRKLWPDRRCRPFDALSQPAEPAPVDRLEHGYDSSRVRKTPAIAGTGPGLAEGAQGVDVVAQDILSARQGASGTIVLVTSATASSENVRATLELARRLARDARAILVGLDESRRFDVGPIWTTSERRDTKPPVRMSDVARGLISFAEVIGRDPGSRLHYVDMKTDSLTDLASAQPVLVALAETYDVVMLAVPALDRDATALDLACVVDQVVLAVPPQPPEIAWRRAEASLIDSGAHRVLVAAARSQLRRPAASRRGRDAA